MYSPRSRLKPPPSDGYQFPFKPYDIQQNFMQSLYEILENKQIGIFESPTGTGKSLTLTCGALRWLLDHEALVKEDMQKNIDELSGEIKSLEKDASKATNWISSQFEASQKRNELSQLKKMHVIICDFERKLEELKALKREEKLAGGKKPKRIDEILDGDAYNQPLIEDDLVLDDCETTELKDNDEDEKINVYKDVKIYFCSRTHSQLTQVVREVKRTAYGGLVRCVSLASRQNLCIHPEVRKLSSTSLINERCLDMAKSQSKVTSTDSNGCAQKKSRRTLTHTKCPHKNNAQVEDLRGSSLVEILDIEDLVTVGQEKRACPYYAARAAAKDAQLIMLPYQMLLHRKTRAQSAIDLQNSIVIIDEAHNLLDTISSIYSSEISLHQLSLALNQISAYKMHYCARFSTKNLLKINQMIFILKRLVKMLTPLPESENSNISATSRMIKTHELMAEGEFFNINIFHILEFCENTRFAQKLQGFAQRMNSKPNLGENQEPTTAVTGALGMLKKLQDDNLKKKEKSSKKLATETTAEEGNVVKSIQSQQQDSSPIRPLLAFWESLTECADDGRILLTYNATDHKKAGMKFILLNPGGHFEEIVRDARAIIIAGGTMQPTAELIDQLFKSCPERVHLKFYDHVVSADAVLPFVVAKGPTGKRFCFNFTLRNSVDMLSELGMTLQNLCNVIPAGIVCFFSSYDYLETVCNNFQKEGILEKILQKKYFFRESRSASSEKLLADYGSAIKNTDRSGAIIFSVVGGKLSEGLNFSDDLGRCVIVIGMPYSNRNSPELQERIKYLDSTLGAGAGNEYYENLCMKAVNQCIGRSVRHINDYASVLLLDERYSNDKVRNKLPQWISRNLKVSTSFGMIQGATAKFFRLKKANGL